MINNYKTIKQKASIKWQLFVFAILMLFSVSSLNAQVTGVKNIPGDYADLASALSDLNTNGVGIGGATINIATGYTETAPVGGFVLGSPILNASLSIANPLVIQRAATGLNPLLTAYTGGTGTPGTAVQDGIFKIVGCDYVTIDGIDLSENPANLANPSTMEYGYAMYKASATDGCQNNTIQNCNITLNRINNAGGTGPAIDGSRGIDIVNALSTAATTAVAVTNATGANSNNRIYANTIQNCNYGISLIGFAAAAPYTNADQNNDIGGSSLATGNTILNFGGGAATNPAAGIRTLAQYGLNISYNTINNNNGSGVNHAATLRGIYTNTAAAATEVISNNTISIKSGATTSQVSLIENVAGSGAGSVTINNNTFTNCSYTTQTSGVIYGIYNNGATPSNLTINGNTFNPITLNTTAGSGSVNFIYITGTIGTLSSVSSNVFANQSLNTTGNVYLIYNSNNTNTFNINNNSISGTFAKTASGNIVYGYYNFGSPTGGTATITGNNFSNITLTGATQFFGIRQYTATSQVEVINNNTISNVVGGTSAVVGISHGYGAATSSVNDNNVFNFTNGAAITGIVLGDNTGGLGLTANNNRVYGLSSTAGAVVGISLSLGSTTNLSKNKIYDLQSSNATGTVNGILIAAGTNNNVSNNIIGDLRAPLTSSTTDAVRGINITSTTALATNRIYYNSIYLAATSSGTNFSTSGVFHATSATATTSALDLRNNIIINKSTANGTGIASAYRRSNATLTNYSTTSNNNLFYAGTPSASSLIFYDGTNSDQTIGAFKTRMVTRDVASVTEDVNFISTTGSNSNFLHIANGTSTFVESGAVDIASYPDDFDGNIRYNNLGYAGTSTTGTDIGADEFDGIVVPQCAGIPTAGTISGLAAVCSGLGTNLTLSGASSDLGITYQWASSTTPGGPYTNMGTNMGQATGALTVPTYYVVTVTCSNSGMSAVTTEKSVLINSLPIVAATPSAGTYCAPGGAAVAIAASGASTYTWLPATGLSATSGANVNASPSATTNYTVTGTDGNGCVNTATAVITVGAMPTVSSVTASPAAVCSGANSQLQANATIAYNNTAAAYSFAGSTGTYTPIAGTVLGAGIIGDDVGIGNLPIGFTFNYNGVNHTVFGVSSNGLIQLSQTNATFGGLSANSLATNANSIAALWDDNHTAGATVSYLTSGTSPNQVLTVQWTGMHVGGGGSNSNPTIDLQILLYEATGQIQIIYGSTSAALASTTASIGISGAVGNYLSVTPLSPANTSTTSSTSENTGINSATNFPTGTIYTFTPPVAPTLAYSWSPATFLSATNIANPMASAITASTTYTATVTSSLGCVATGTVAISAGDALSATAVVAPSNTVCVGSNINLNGTTIGGGGPFTYAWAGPNGFTSAQEDTVINAVSAAAAGTYTLTVSDACGANTTAQVTLTVNSLPSVAVTPNSGAICLPGGSAVNLTASNANTYAWSPASGLSATTGSAVSANPTATTVYTVTGTDGNGCVNATQVTIFVSNNPTITATATPSTICTGGNSQLLANATIPFTYILSTVPFVAEPTPVTAGPNGDDAVSAALPIGFTFNYYGVNYTQFAISTNGNIQLGDGSGAANNPTYSAVFTDAAIPNAAAPNNFVALAWDDWDVSAGQITYGTTGTAPNRKLVVSFNTTGRGGGNADTLNGQIVLEETVNTVRLNMIKKGVSTNSATQGIENATGSVTSNGVPGRQNSAWNVNNESRLFTPLPGAFTYNWSPATFLDNASIANPLASSVTTSTIYTVTATETTSGCVSSQTVNVDITPFTAVNIVASPSATVCAGTTVTLTATPVGGATPYVFNWLPGAVTTAAITYTATATQTYTVEITDNCGVMITQTITINVNPLPVVTTTPTTSTYCSGGTAVAISASGADTYTWLPAAGLNVTNAANVNATPTANTTYTVTGTDANNCVNTATVVIASAATPTVSASAMPSTPVCAGDTVQLSSSADIPLTYVQTIEPYSPETTPATSGPSGDDVVSAALPIGFTFKYFGVSYTQFAISTNGNIQLGNGSGTANNPTFSTQYADAAIPNTGAPNNMIALAWDDWSVTAGQITYGLTGTSPNQKMVVSFITTGRGGGGADTLDGQIALEETTNKIYMNINKKGIQATNTATQGLENQTGGVTSTIVVGRNNQAWSLNKETRVFTPYSGTYTYSWSPATSLNDATIANPLAQSIQTSTVYTITATETSGCTASATVSITVNPVPAVSLGADITACSTDLPVTLDAGNAGATFLWNTTDATQSIVASNGGSYSVIVTDANGCIGKDTVLITENPNPVVTLGIDTTRCGGSVTLDAANVGSTYLWNDNTTAQTLVATSTGTYSVQVTDVNGCTGNDAIDVTINSQPVVNLGNDTLVCGSGITLDAGNVGLSFLWNDNSTSQTLTATNSDTYFVTVSTPQNCTDRDTIIVTIAAPISVDLGNDSAVCASTTIILDAQNSGATYLWNDNSTSSTLIVTTFGTYAVEVTSPDGCIAKDTVVYTDNSPIVSLSLPFSTTCVNTSVNALSGGLPAGGFYSGAGVTGANFDATAVSAGNTTIDYTYTDVITGCSAIASSIVVVDPCVGISQISTSNDYGVYPNPSNGKFEIRVPSKDAEFSAKLYSAEGKLVYESNFSGRDSYSVNISELPNAVYFLKIYVDSGIKVVKVVKQY